MGGEAGAEDEGEEEEEAQEEEAQEEEAQEEEEGAQADYLLFGRREVVGDQGDAGELTLAKIAELALLT